MKKLLQKIFKNFFYWLFKKIYGQISIDDKINNFKVFKIESNKIKNFYKNSYKVYFIPNGRIYTDNVEHVGIIDNNNNLCGEVSYQQIKGELKDLSFNACIKKGTPRIKKYFKGRTLNLAQGASGHTNYAHWLFDMLPKIKLYEEKFSLKELSSIYVNKLNSFQKLSFELLNLEKIKIIDSNKFRHIQSDEIIATQHPNYYHGYIMEEHQKLPEWIIHWLRESFIQKSKKINSVDKIFIDRSNSKFKHCQIINYEDTIEFLTSSGFKILKLEELTFVEQISLFNQSKIIIGAHGAGFANLSFCNPGTKIIEIRPANHPNKIYERISFINKLDYDLYSTIVEKNSNSIGDINVNIDKLKFLIR
jgi:capsular polysaccharide biosynthesis protein